MTQPRPAEAAGATARSSRQAATSGPATRAFGPATRGLGPLQPVDRLTLAFLVVLAAVTLAAHPEPVRILLGITLLAAAVTGTAAIADRSRTFALIHAFFPVLSVVAIFTLCGPLIALANPLRADALLAEVDARIFPGLASAWLGALGRPWWLTDAASVAYCSYYVIPVAIAGALWERGRTRELEAFVFAVLATFFASYVGYFLVPTLGPRVAEAEEARVLGGSAISAAVRAFLRVAELNRLDAFPSGHTAVSLVYLVMGWRMLPRWRAPLALLVGGIVFATVYLSLHYVVDVVAGVLLAACMPLVVRGLRRIFGWPSPGSARTASRVPTVAARGALHRPARRVALEV